MSVPTSLQFGSIAGSIRNQSRLIGGLQVQPGKTLALVGGDVRLDGGIVEAPGGRVELGGVAGAGTVGLQVDGNNLRLSFPDDVALADVSLTNGADVYFSEIQVQGRRVKLSNFSFISSTTPKLGEAVVVNASESVTDCDELWSRWRE